MPAVTLTVSSPANRYCRRSDSELKMKPVGHFKTKMIDLKFYFDLFYPLPVGEKPAFLDKTCFKRVLRRRLLVMNCDRVLMKCELL